MRKKSVQYYNTSKSAEHVYHTQATTAGCEVCLQLFAGKQEHAKRDTENVDRS